MTENSVAGYQHGVGAASSRCPAILCIVFFPLLSHRAVRPFDPLLYDSRSVASSWRAGKASLPSPPFQPRLVDRPRRTARERPAEPIRRWPAAAISSGLRGPSLPAPDSSTLLARIVAAVIVRGFCQGMTRKSAPCLLKPLALRKARVGLTGPSFYRVCDAAEFSGCCPPRHAGDRHQSLAVVVFHSGAQ